MGKKDKMAKYPFVSICTPTFNRRPFIPIIIKCFENQNYPNFLNSKLTSSKLYKSI